MARTIVYQDTRFDTEQHARWAVFFTHLGISWEYLPPAEVLQNGTIFKPAFWLPTFDGGMAVNCCEDQETENTSLDESGYCVMTGKSILHANGWPSGPRVLTYYQRYDDRVAKYVGLPNADKAKDSNRMFVEPCYEDVDGTIGREARGFIGEHYIEAIVAAAAWDFDHIDG